MTVSISLKYSKIVAVCSDALLDKPSESMKGFDFESMNYFLQQYFEGTLLPSVRSEDVPDYEDSKARGALFTTLVGANFEDK
jgi:hypothetical protein